MTQITVPPQPTSIDTRPVPATGTTATNDFTPGYTGLRCRACGNILVVEGSLRRQNPIPQKVPQRAAW